LAGLVFGQLFSGWAACGRVFWGTLLAASILTAFQAPAAAAEEPRKLRLGLLPIADTVLLHVAQRSGFFGAEGLEAEFVPFQSADEKNAAVMAGGLDGHFCEISAAIVQRAHGLPYVVAATTTHTDPAQRVFGLVVKPGSTAKSLADLRGASLAGASRTIIDFLTDVFLAQAGLPDDFVERRDIQKIPLRVQTLLAGQLDGAVLPEPLLSVVEKAGGRVIVDDRTLNMPLAVVALRADLADRATVEAFRRALARAVAQVNSQPVQTRALMLELGLIPPSLADWTPPRYNPATIPESLPGPAVYDAYVAWLVKNEVLGPPGAGGRLKPAPAYEDVVFGAAEAAAAGSPAGADE
jgi:NitT/TauT family transport system substrate-binding protein